MTFQSLELVRQACLQLCVSWEKFAEGQVEVAARRTTTESGEY
jgi:hypothetical protein